MEFDAFSQGIEPGGLRSSAEIKLLICYLLKNINKPLSREIIVNALQYDGLVNFFEIGSAISDLSSGGSVRIEEIDGKEHLSLTNTGLGSVSALEFIVPGVVRDKALKAAIRILDRRRNERENHVSIKKADDDTCFVTCSVMEDERPLMEITLRVADTAQADFIKHRFLDNPALVYQKTLEALIDEPLDKE